MPSVNLGHTLDPRTEGKGFGAKSLGKQTLREGNVKHQTRKRSRESGSEYQGGT
jgi:hypothetical protein